MKNPTFLRNKNQNKRANYKTFNSFKLSQKMVSILFGNKRGNPYFDFMFYCLISIAAFYLLVRRHSLLNHHIKNLRVITIQNYFFQPPL